MRVPALIGLLVWASGCRASLGMLPPEAQKAARPRADRRVADRPREDQRQRARPAALHLASLRAIDRLRHGDLRSQRWTAGGSADGR